jgi:hypothetical protein
MVVRRNHIGQQIGLPGHVILDEQILRVRPGQLCAHHRVQKWGHQREGEDTHSRKRQDGTSIPISALKHQAVDRVYSDNHGRQHQQLPPGIASEGQKNGGDTRVPHLTLLAHEAHQSEQEQGKPLGRDQIGVVDLVQAVRPKSIHQAGDERRGAGSGQVARQGIHPNSTQHEVEHVDQVESRDSADQRLKRQPQRDVIPRDVVIEQGHAQGVKDQVGVEQIASLGKDALHSPAIPVVHQ